MHGRCSLLVSFGGSNHGLVSVVLGVEIGSLPVSPGSREALVMFISMNGYLKDLTATNSGILPLPMIVMNELVSAMAEVSTDDISLRSSSLWNKIRCSENKPSGNLHHF